MYSSDSYRAPHTYCRCTCGRYQPPTCLFILSRASRIEIVSYDISVPRSYQEPRCSRGSFFHHAVASDFKFDCSR